jgi:hypothetical protein
MWRLMTILFEDRAGLLKVNGFSEAVAYQLCWLLRCNKVYSGSVSLKGKQRRSRGSDGQGQGAGAPTTPPGPVAQMRPPATPATLDRRAREQLARKARGMFDGDSGPDQTVRREQTTKLAEQTTNPVPDQPDKTSRAAELRERALGKLATLTAQADKTDADMHAGAQTFARTNRP